MDQIPCWYQGRPAAPLDLETRSVSLTLPLSRAGVRHCALLRSPAMYIWPFVDDGPPLLSVPTVYIPHQVQLNLVLWSFKSSLESSLLIVPNLTCDGNVPGVHAPLVPAQVKDCERLSNALVLRDCLKARDGESGGRGCERLLCGENVVDVDLGLDIVQQASPRTKLQRLVRRSRGDQTDPPWEIIVLPTFQELKLLLQGSTPQGACVERLAPRALPGESEVSICERPDNGWQRLICRG